MFAFGTCFAGFFYVVIWLRRTLYPNRGQFVRIYVDVLTTMGVNANIGTNNNC
jgi:hypothetical protein